MSFKVFNIIIAAVILGGLGLIFGVVLGIASKVFEVYKDERVDKIMAVLPCANCGGCGFAGCSSFAQAVVDGKAQPTACSVGGSACADSVSEIMGVKADFVKKVASKDVDLNKIKNDTFIDVLNKKISG